MSVTMAKADGATVLTLTADPQGRCPPLCQILKGLCYSPFCCSVSQHLRRVQKNSQSVLGALHIMVGWLNIGLGLLLCFCSGFWSGIGSTAFPVWLGVLFMLFGIMSVLSEKYPNRCLVIINVILNVTGVAFAITAIVLYSITLSVIWNGGGWWWLLGESWCDQDNNHSSIYNTQRPLSSQEDFIKRKCLEGKALATMLLRSINVVLIVMSILEVCVTTSSAVIGIKALRSNLKGDDKSNDDPEHYKTLLEEVTNNPKE